MINNIEPSQVKNISGIIIDLRNSNTYNESHIPNAINIKAEKLMIEPQKYLKKNEIYYVYCQKGITSKNICKILSIKGYKVVNINGGYEKWIKEQ